MDVIWQRILFFSEKPFPILLLSKALYRSLSVNDIAVTVARRVLSEVFPLARSRRLNSQRNRHDPRHQYYDTDGAYNFHPSVLVGYVSGYLIRPTHEAVVRQLTLMGAKHVDVALQVAARRGDIAICECLIAAGAAINKNDGMSLRWAALSGHPDVVKLLLSYGADKTVLSDAPIRLAALKGHCEIIDLLLADGGEYPPAALRSACVTNNVEAIALLLRKGASITIGAVDSALSQRSTLPLRLLLAHGFPPQLAFRRINFPEYRQEHIAVIAEFSPLATTQNPSDTAFADAFAALGMTIFED